jgi:hypothetical protein
MRKKETPKAEQEVGILLSGERLLYLTIHWLDSLADDVCHAYSVDRVTE